MFGIDGFGVFCIIAGSISLLIWMLFFFKGLKYNEMFAPLEEKQFPLKEVYGMGYAVLETFHYSYKSKRDRNLRQLLEVLYGEKYCEYYLRVVHAQQISIAMTMFVLSFSFYGLTTEPAAFAIGLMFAGLAYYYYGTDSKNKIEKRSEELLHDFCEVVSKLALLTNAGMILHEAWNEVAFAGEGIIYNEMRTAVSEMNNGKADVDAIYSFGTRCMLPEIKKFTATITQGISKGNSELTSMLQQQSKEVWMLKKQLVRREGDKANSKLLIPICVMFIGILIMILVPIFANIGNV